MTAPTDLTVPRFSIVIPNWNGKRFLPGCLDSLLQQTYPNLEIIVADNASTDGSLELLAQAYPEVKVVRLPENRGFTGACNAGMKASTGEFVSLLNNDTEIDPNWAAEVVAAFGRHPEAGLVASKMLLYDKRDHFHTAGDYYRVDGWPGNRGVWQRDQGQYDREEYVFSACGGSSAYRKSLLDQIGLLDDDFFFSMEDIDLAWRAQLAGWKCVFAPKAIVYHMLSATGGGATASYYDGRNAIYVIVKDLPRAVWRRYWRRILGRQFGLAWEALRAWRGKSARARLRGMLAGVRHLPALLRKRRAIQRDRRVSEAYIFSLLVDPKTDSSPASN